MAKQSVIGGELVKEKGAEAIKDLQENRTMIVQKLTQSPPSKPVVVENLKNIGDVFDNYKPSAEVTFKDKDGGNISEELNFNTLADFSLDGITEQSAFLKDLNTQSEVYQLIIRELKNNNKLKKVLSDGGGKTALLKALVAIMKEIEESEK
jgi:predicted component of type VI protein secretion system